MPSKSVLENNTVLILNSLNLSNTLAFGLLQYKAATSMWLMVLKCLYILTALDPDPDAKMMIFLFVLSNLYSNIANELSASAICTLTNSGYTAWQISSWRPSAIILVFTSNKRILSQLGLLWGVKCVYYDNFVSTDKTVEEVNELAIEKGFVKTGDLVINLAAMPVKEKGQVNTLRISRL